MVSTEPPQIPKSILKRLLDFLKENRTGKIVLNIRRGTVMNLEVSETVTNEDLKQSQ